MNYHKITRVISLLVNTNTKFNIVDRMSIIANVNEYFLSLENRIRELEKQIEKQNKSIQIQKPNK